MAYIDFNLPHRSLQNVIFMVENSGSDLRWRHRHVDSLVGFRNDRHFLRADGIRRLEGDFRQSRRR